MLAKTTVAVMTIAVMQAPARIATEALVLRRLRRLCPEMFDGHRAAAVVAACLDEYRSELTL
jgi:hypothetical protein